MIRKSFLIFSILFLIYNYIAIPGFINSNPEVNKIAQSQWQENIISAQNYFYQSSENINKILVGSSLSARISDSSWYNLSFLGGSGLTGLELIKLKAEFPRFILIETNLIARQTDAEIIASVNKNPLNKLRTYFPSFLEKNQPLKFIGALFYSTIEIKKANNPIDQTFFQNLVNIQVKANASVINKESTNKNILYLKELVLFFEKNKVKIYLLEMPINKTIYATKNECYRRAELFKAFPKNQYNWILPDSNHIYSTTDGVHLTEEGASFFKYEIRKAIAATI